MVVSAGKAAQLGTEVKPPKKRHKTRWITITEGAVFALPAGDEGALLMVREPGGDDLWMGFRLPQDAWTFGEARKIMKRPAERAFAAGVVEDRARKLGVFSLSSDQARWRTQPVSAEQERRLNKELPGLQLPGTRGEASDIITAHTLRQKMRTFSK